MLKAEEVKQAYIDGRFTRLDIIEMYKDKTITRNEAMDILRVKE